MKAFKNFKLFLLTFLILFQIQVNAFGYYYNVKWYYLPIFTCCLCGDNIISKIKKSRMFQEKAVKINGSKVLFERRSLRYYEDGAIKSGKLVNGSSFFVANRKFYFYK